MTPPSSSSSSSFNAVRSSQEQDNKDRGGGRHGDHHDGTASPTTTNTSTTTTISSSHDVVDVNISNNNYNNNSGGTLATTTTTTTSLDANNTVHENVKLYYGKELQSSNDLQTNACCTGDAPPAHIRACISLIHDEIVSKYYGCGLCIPSYDMTGCNVLDLGCGAGRDVYIISQLVGSTGRVVGIDMTNEQLDVARKHQQYHREKFGYTTNNVEFYHGYLESLHEMVDELQPSSFDIIISNCVINLCTDKHAVFKACYELLKPGGELYFSDVYANRRIPQQLQQNPILWGECLSGALYWNDFLNMVKNVGFIDPRLVGDSIITIANPKVSEMFDNAGYGTIQFYSATYRLFNISSSSSSSSSEQEYLEPACEDYGQAVIYNGTMPRNPTCFKLDKHHIFEVGKLERVCGNTWIMLQHNKQISNHFTFVGDFKRHYGIFDGCGTIIPYDTPTNENGGGKGNGACC